MLVYIATPEEAEFYSVQLWDAIKSGLFRIRVEAVFPFSPEGIREAHELLTTPGGKLAGKTLLKIADE